MNEDNEFNRDFDQPDKDGDKDDGDQLNFPNNNNNFRNIALIVGAIIISLILFQTLFNAPSNQSELSYSDFISRVESGEVASVTIKGGSIKGVDDRGREFTSRGPTDPAAYLEKLRNNNVEITIKEASEGNWFFSLLISLLPVLLIIGLWVFMMRRMQGNNALNFGKSQANLVNKEFSDVSFEDFAGVKEVKEEVEEIVEYLRNPQRFKKLGAEVPKGMILVGPPGTGKTLLSRAIAGEAEVPFYQTSGSNFVEMFVGVGASRVRNMFKQAKENAPSIIFIDELDAIGRKRGAGLGGGHDEREQTLNELLSEMDGFDPNEGVIILAATNRPDVLDPALLRPGRFDRKITVPAPDIKGREEILELHTQNKQITEDVDLEVLARRTPGFVGADLENLANEAALLAGRRGKDEVEMTDFEESIDRVIAGVQRKGMAISDDEKEKIAYHESGHALIGKLLPNADPVHKISIVPRSNGALGFTLQLPLEEKFLVSKSELLDKLTTLLGGRTAEELIYDEVTTGAQDDFKKVTDIAKRMVVQYGMSEKLGPINLGRENGNVFLGEEIVKSNEHSEEVSSMVDKEIRKIVESCHSKAENILTQNKEVLKKLAEELIEVEELEGDQLEDILDQAALPASVT
ncbi:ATP-dependent zinc metalloprotease FtsH [Candidatus Bipolaricaulota bacterium]|nr:ATP-dependent zinc metalloprotease FtsH [Candidatus Bipolaricaulota bacterium]MBS3813991.1 ATP-dependent zinc metalloprotease FtsH [Candidatus Bipolaricaulota bacterium]MBS3825122.1 ATP-dependent zinc metalloprotease FtsH [Candidatus Bipolaricaulota bacterium]